MNALLLSLALCSQPDLSGAWYGGQWGVAITPIGEAYRVDWYMSGETLSHVGILTRSGNDWQEAWWQVGNMGGQPCIGHWEIRNGEVRAYGYTLRRVE